MTLQDLITRLEQEPQDKVIAEGFCNPHSHRGSYSQLAFEPCSQTSIAYLLDVARSAMGQTYSGWKGGEFFMDEWSDVYIAEIGNSGYELSPRLLEYMLKDIVKY